MQDRRKHFGLALMQVKFKYVNDKYDHVLWMNVAYRLVDSSFLSITTLLLTGSTLVWGTWDISVRYKKNTNKLEGLGLCFMSLQISLIFLFFCLNKTFEENSFQN